MSRNRPAERKSSYLPLFDEQLHYMLSKEPRPIDKEKPHLERNSLDVILQSIRRAKKIEHAKTQGEFNSKTHREFISNLFDYACRLRYALAPFLMMTAADAPNILTKVDKQKILSEIEDPIKYLKLYLNTLKKLFDANHFIIYVHGMQYIEDNAQLFFSITEPFRYTDVKSKNNASTTYLNSIKNALMTFFDFCALPQELYTITSGKMAKKRGLHVPTVASTSVVYIISVKCPAFPNSPFPKSWNIIRTNNDSYKVMHLSRNPLITPAQAVGMYHGR